MAMPGATTGLFTSSSNATRVLPVTCQLRFVADLTTTPGQDSPPRRRLRWLRNWLRRRRLGGYIFHTRRFPNRVRDFRMANIAVCTRDGIAVANNATALDVVNPTRLKSIAGCHGEYVAALRITTVTLNTKGPHAAVFGKGRSVLRSVCDLSGDSGRQGIPFADRRVETRLRRDDGTTHKAPVNDRLKISASRWRVRDA